MFSNKLNRHFIGKTKWCSLGWFGVVGKTRLIWCWSPVNAWWRHQMETFSALLAICAQNSPVPCEFRAQKPVTRSFSVFFDLHPNKRLSKQWRGWWLETPSCPIRRYRNGLWIICRVTKLGPVRVLSYIDQTEQDAYLMFGALLDLFMCHICIHIHRWLYGIVWWTSIKNKLYMLKSWNFSSIISYRTLEWPETGNINLRSISSFAEIANPLPLYLSRIIQSR